MSVSFREKSIGVSLVVIMAIAIYYFMNVFDLAMRQGAFQAELILPEGALGLAITTLILIIVVEATLQTVLAVGAGQVPAATSKDHTVAAKAMRNAYWILTGGVVISFGSLFLNTSAFVMGNLLLMFFVIAELTKFVSQLVYYRRSVDEQSASGT